MQKLLFEVNNATLEEVHDSAFSILEMEVFASGENAHGYPVSPEALKNASWTIYNKPIVWLPNFWKTDATTHAEGETPCGFIFPENNPPQYKTLSDGRIMFSVKGYIWKKYTGNLIDIFQRDSGKKAVSVEISVIDSKKINEKKFEITDYCYEAVTILGRDRVPAIPGANAKVIRFSKDEINDILTFSKNGVDMKLPESIKESMMNAKLENVTSVVHALIKGILEKNELMEKDIRRMASLLKRHNGNYNYIAMGGKEASNWTNMILDAIDRESKKSFFEEATMKDEEEVLMEENSEQNEPSDEAKEKEVFEEESKDTSDETGESKEEEQEKEEFEDGYLEVSALAAYIGRGGILDEQNANLVKEQFAMPVSKRNYMAVAKGLFEMGCKYEAKMQEYEAKMREYEAVAKEYEVKKKEQENKEFADKVTSVMNTVGSLFSDEQRQKFEEMAFATPSNFDGWKNYVQAQAFEKLNTISTKENKNDKQVFAIPENHEISKPATDDYLSLFDNQLGGK